MPSDKAWLAKWAKKKKAVAQIGNQEVGLKIADHPRRFGSFGFASEPYSVQLPDGFFPKAEIIIPLHHEVSQLLLLYSVRIFWWDAGAKTFRLVQASGIDENARVAWGRITKSGIYIAVGYPRDAGVQGAIACWEISRPFHEVQLSKSQSLGQRLCRAMLESQESSTDGIVGQFLPWRPMQTRGTVKARRKRRGRLDRDVKSWQEIAKHLQSEWLLPESLLASRLDRLEIVRWKHFLYPLWSNVGPHNVTGVVRALAAHPGDSDTLYAAAEYGGVWRTVDGCATWNPLMDQERNLHVDALALCRAVPTTIYSGTSDSYGDLNIDLYKSIDGGLTWNVMTPVTGTMTNAIAVHPTDPDTVYLANNYGLHLSTDGGLTWKSPPHTFLDGTHMLNNAGIFEGWVDDVKLDIDNPSIVYIAARQKGLLKSIDGGNTWRRLAPNYRFSVLDDDKTRETIGFSSRFRMVLSIGEEKNPYTFGTRLLVVKIQDTVLITMDGGEGNWRVLSKNFGYSWQNHWCSCVGVSPTDEEFVVAGGAIIEFIDEAKRTKPFIFQIPDYIHADQQAIEFLRTEEGAFFFANDGGIGKAWNWGYGVSKVSDGLIATQCMNVTVSQTKDLIIASATNHTGTIRSRANDISSWDWIDGPELGVVEIHPDLPNLVFSSSGGGPIPPQPLRRSIDGGKTWAQVASPVWPFLVICPSDTRYMLAASATSGELLISSDYGVTWQKYMNAEGAPINLDALGLSSCAFAPYFPPPLRANGYRCFIGSAGGHLWHYPPGGLGGTWSEINTPLVANNDGSVRIQSIATHPTDLTVLYVGYGGRQSRPIWRGMWSNLGYQWTNASGMLPNTSLPAAPVIRIIIDPWNPLRLFAATTIGVFVTEDEGQWWKPARRGLPNVAITDMRLHVQSRTLIVSTWGRGIFQSSFELGDGFDQILL